MLQTYDRGELVEIVKTKQQGRYMLAHLRRGKSVCFVIWLRAPLPGGYHEDVEIERMYSNWDRAVARLEELAGATK